MGKKGRIIRVGDEHVFYSFDPEIPPVAEVDPGDLVIIRTRDCLSNQIVSESQSISSIDFSQVNPATGPIYIRGARAGDALAVHVEDIRVSERGFIVVVPGGGFLGDLVRESRIRLCRVVGNEVVFQGAKIPARFMVGVIGVATRDRTPTGVPGRHGGNLDTVHVTKGSTIYLPVEFDGALFGVGDLHAAMGDGEICISGCEVSGEVEIEFRILSGMAPAWPVVEAGDSIYILVSREGIEESLREASKIAVEIMSRAFTLDWLDAYMLSSMAIDIQISQLVDPRKTVRIRIPRRLLDVEKLLSILATIR